MVGHEDYESPLVQPLTPREEEILNCLGDGMSNRQIAGHFIISINTVKWYVRKIYGKLGVDNRSTAVARAQSLGLLPTEQADQVRNNLPVAVTPFVGREEELAALARLVANPQVRIITILGPGGIGKTRLALEAAKHELGRRTSFQNGIFFVSLTSLEPAGEIVTALATSLDFHFQGDSRNERQQILDYLRQKQMLLVIDNFEHILGEAKLLAKIGEQAANVKLLVRLLERAGHTCVIAVNGQEAVDMYAVDKAEAEVNSDHVPFDTILVRSQDLLLTTKLK